MFQPSEKLKEYQSMMQEEVDPSITPSTESLTTIGAPINAATIANWTEAGHDYASQRGMEDQAKKILAMHKEALDNADFKDANTELNKFYFSTFELKRAEINLAAIAKRGGDDVDGMTLPYIDTQIDSFSSSTERAIVRSYGIFTSTLNSLKQGISKLKETILKAKQGVKKLTSEIKDRIVAAFNYVLDSFYKLVSEFLTRMFSFIQMIGRIAASKGFKLKTVNVSFEPPSFETVSFLGFPIPLPKVSLPKVEVGFDINVPKIEENNNNTSTLTERKKTQSERANGTSSEVELDQFDVNFSFRCPKCDFLNEEISAPDLLNGLAECGMCETVFKAEGLDSLKVIAIFG
jgi:hypothetical protein